MKFHKSLRTYGEYTLADRFEKIVTGGAPKVSLRLKEKLVQQTYDLVVNDFKKYEEGSKLAFLMVKVLGPDGKLAFFETIKALELVEYFDEKKNASSKFDHFKDKEYPESFWDILNDIVHPWLVKEAKRIRIKEVGDYSWELTEGYNKAGDYGVLIVVEKE